MCCDELEKIGINVVSKERRQRACETDRILLIVLNKETELGYIRGCSHVVIYLSWSLVQWPSLSMSSREQSC